MTNTCATCGHTESQAIVEAKTLGLQQEFESGIYTCCQIVEWAAEQSQAWFEATHDCRKPDGHDTKLPDYGETESLLVRVRTKRQKVPWFRSPGDFA
jgi:hypothetical protein